MEPPALPMSSTNGLALLLKARLSLLNLAFFRRLVSRNVSRRTKPTTARVAVPPATAAVVPASAPPAAALKRPGGSSSEALTQLALALTVPLDVALLVRVDVSVSSALGVRDIGGGDAEGGALALTVDGGEGGVLDVPLELEDNDGGRLALALKLLLAVVLPLLEGGTTEPLALEVSDGETDRGAALEVALLLPVLLPLLAALPLAVTVAAAVPLAVRLLAALEVVAALGL